MKREIISSWITAIVGVVIALVSPEYSLWQYFGNGIFCTAVGIYIGIIATQKHYRKKMVKQFIKFNPN